MINISTFNPISAYNTIINLDSNFPCGWDDQKPQAQEANLGWGPGAELPYSAKF